MKFIHLRDRDDLNDPEVRKKQIMLLKRRRIPHNEPCNIPNQILFRFQTSALGCMKIAFSPDGDTLAAACTHQNSRTIIKIFDVEDGTLRCILKGHKNIIHDLDWTLDSEYLVSCSSDFTCKLWKIPDSESGGEVEEEDSEKHNLICTFPHPSYVYSAKIFPHKNEDGLVNKILIATACFDSKVRLWVAHFDMDNKCIGAGKKIFMLTN